MKDTSDSASAREREGHAEGAEVLRFITAGSVDDGKSTLIGRLLYDTKTIFEDQLEGIEEASQRRGDERVDLALLTDGLRAEREQGITIDVAYRYFSTPRRKFIIADAPGHAQYTKNMVTGASTADLAIVLLDARQGVLDQTRRHTVVASLLGVQHIVFAINKMDLVDYDEAVFNRIRSDVTAFIAKLQTRDVEFIPMSALVGDNVVDESEAMPWYHGPSLLHHLETVHIASDRNLIDVRFPVQRVIRPQSDELADYRGYAGMMASGTLRKGDEVVVLPGGEFTRVEQIDNYGEEVDEAFPPMMPTVRLEDDLDVSRGNVISRVGNRPFVGAELDAMVVWFGDRPIRQGDRYAIKHTTRWVRGTVTDLRYELDLETLHRRQDVDSLEKNDIGRISLRATAPLCYDPYDRNRVTGSFILVDEGTNETVGAGLLLAPMAVATDSGDAAEGAPAVHSARSDRPQTYLITGVADERSLATAVAQRLADDGHRLIFSGLGRTDDHGELSERAAGYLDRSYAAFESTIDRVFGEDATRLPLDVTLDASLDALAAKLQEDEVELDGVFHSIAMDKTIRAGAVKNLLDVTHDEFMQAMGVSAYSLISLTRSLLRGGVLARSSSIVAVSYRGAQYVMQHPYKNVGVAKAALERIVKELAHELGPSHGIRVNAVRFSPYAGSKAGGAIPGLAEAEEIAQELSPLGNALPEHLAAEVAYLLSRQSAITGDVRNVDGGYSIRG